MPYASDKLYKEYVRRNMARFATEVKVREILPHLPCMTQSDREEVEAKREMTGNYNAIQLLIDNLKRRENWPDEFIRALEACEHPKLAQEMRDAYEALKQPEVMPQAAGVSDSSGAVTTAHVHPPPPAVSEPAQPPVPAEPAAEPTAPAPVSSPEPLVTPDVTSQPDPPPVMVLEAAPTFGSIPPTIAEVPEDLPTEEAQAPDLSAPPELDIPDGPTHTHASPVELSESSMPPDLQPPAEETAPESPEQARAPVQETSSPDCRVNPLLREPEETSDPTMQQVSTEQRPAEVTEDEEVQPPPPDMQHITPPAPAPVSAPVVAMIHQPPPSLLDSKPEVLQSAVEDPCSFTTDDMELSTPASTSASEVHSEVAPRADTDESPEPVPQLDTAPSLTETYHTQEPVTVKENGSPSHQPNGLLDDQAPSPPHSPTSLCSSSLSPQDQSTVVHVVHVSQDPSIQNQDGQEDTSMVNHSDTQSEASLTEPTSNHHNLTPSTVGNEVHLSPVKEEASATEDTSCTKTEVILEARDKEAQEKENNHQEDGESNEEEQRENPLAGLLPALQNVPLIPAAAAVGVCALVFAWKLRN